MDKQRQSQEEVNTIFTDKSYVALIDLVVDLLGKRWSVLSDGKRVTNIYSSKINLGFSLVLIYLVYVHAKFRCQYIKSGGLHATFKMVSSGRRATKMVYIIIPIFGQNKD